MASSLPPDVMVLVCEELGNKQDFKTLFNCALASKHLVNPALSWLYRIHNQSKLFQGADAEMSKLPSFQARREQQIAAMSKWALLWKSIILSSIGKTAYPYALYIRSLDLRNLTNLLDEPLFREHIMENFFSEDMAQFLRAHETPIKKRTRNGRVLGMRLDIPGVLELVGESITSFVTVAATQNHATVALDDIAPGDISSVVLPRWIGRLSRLKSMTLWDGVVLNEDVANAINSSCPNFNDLTFLYCSDKNTDPNLAAFFGALRSNSLESLDALSAEGIGPETLLALNNQAKSLKTLKVDGLRTDALKNLSLLQGCLALEVLALKDSRGLINLEATENDTFIELVEWLKRCEQLRELYLNKFVSAPALLANLCVNNNTHLRKLGVEKGGYTLKDNIEFHRALSHQTTLESLRLAADDPEPNSSIDKDTLVASICELTKLTSLDLCQTSDYFSTSDINAITASLTALETLKFTGYGITDNVWHSLSGLHGLRALEIQALTSFSVNGILGYISTLQPTNLGLNLLVLNQNPAHDISEKEQSVIQDSVVKKVDGRFEFVLFREVEDSDIDSDSD